MNKTLAQRLLFAILMSCYMTFFISGLFSFFDFHADLQFVLHWLRNWFIAWPCAALLIWVGAPRVNRLVGRLLT